MAVLVKDWDIPDSCFKCPFKEFHVQYGSSECGLTSYSLNSDIYYYERHECCPLKEKRMTKKSSFYFLSSSI